MPLHADLSSALKSWDGSPYVRTPKGERYTADGFRAAWTRLMNDTPAGRMERRLHVPRAAGIKRREAARGRMRRP